MVKIESKLSKRNNSEYEIYVDLEAMNGKDVSVKTLKQSLKREFTFIKIENDEDEEKPAINNSTEKPIMNTKTFNEEIINTLDSETFNSNGERVHKSKDLKS